MPRSRAFSQEMIEFYLVLVEDGWDKHIAAVETVKKFNVDAKPDSLVNRAYLDGRVLVKTSRHLNTYTMAMVKDYKRLRDARIMQKKAAEVVRDKYGLIGAVLTIADGLQERAGAIHERSGA